MGRFCPVITGAGVSPTHCASTIPGTFVGGLGVMSPSSSHQQGPVPVLALGTPWEGHQALQKNDTKGGQQAHVPSGCHCPGAHRTPPPPAALCHRVHPSAPLASCPVWLACGTSGWASAGQLWPSTAQYGPLSSIPARGTDPASWRGQGALLGTSMGITCSHSSWENPDTARVSPAVTSPW